MTYNIVPVSLTSGQVKKMQSKDTLTNGVSITLKPTQMNVGEHKLPLTKTQLKHYNKSLADRKGVKITLSKAAVIEMSKKGGIFPFIIPALGALATGALSGAAGFGVKKLLDKITGGAVGSKKKGRGLRLPGSRYAKYVPG